MGFGVHASDVDGTALCRMFNKAISGMGLPKHLSTEHDPLFEYHRWQANLRILDVEEIKTVPHTPVSHAFVERLIGTLRREFLDHALFWSSRDLDRKLQEFRDFYNDHRVHTSLGGDTPMEFSGEAVTNRTDLQQFRWHTHCRGLFQLPIAN